MLFLWLGIRVSQFSRVRGKSDKVCCFCFPLILYLFHCFFVLGALSFVPLRQLLGRVPMCSFSFFSVKRFCCINFIVFDVSESFSLINFARKLLPVVDIIKLFLKKYFAQCWKADFFNFFNFREKNLGCFLSSPFRPRKVSSFVEFLSLRQTVSVEYFYKFDWFHISWVGSIFRACYFVCYSRSGWA